MESLPHRGFNEPKQERSRDVNARARDLSVRDCGTVRAPGPGFMRDCFSRKAIAPNGCFALVADRLMPMHRA
jgi:hypothetical protein